MAADFQTVALGPDIVSIMDHPRRQPQQPLFQRMPREIEEAATLDGYGPYAVFWKIALPKTLPEFFGALKVSVTLAFIGTNLVEIISPHGRGLGALFLSGQTNSNYPLMFAVLIALAFLGIVLYYAVVALERIFAGWAEPGHG